jgi:phosphoribosylformylglycinamidine synthase
LSSLSRLRFGVVVFPGSNCDLDACHVIRNVLGAPCEMVWHQETDLSRFGAVVLPGGFSYGDYLRAGALAAYSPVMDALRRFASDGGLVIGICNGFQILVESGLLPGALVANRSLSFVCKPVHVRVERTDTPFTLRCKEGDVLQMPIAHQSGNYFADAETFGALEAARGVVFRYCDDAGRVSEAANPNGSMGGIAGIVSPRVNVLGLMPHPERAAESALGSEDGRRVFESVAAWLERPASKA